LLRHSNTLSTDGPKFRKSGRSCIEVFGRATSYDPMRTQTVRVKAWGAQAARPLLLREGSKPLRIDCMAGTYVPEFRRSDPAIKRRRALHGAARRRAGLLHTAPSRGICGSRFWFGRDCGRLPCFGSRILRLQPHSDSFWSPCCRYRSVALCSAFVRSWAATPYQPPLKPRKRVLHERPSL